MANLKNAIDKFNLNKVHQSRHIRPIKNKV